jgi:hypothetical protein
MAVKVKKFMLGILATTSIAGSLSPSVTLAQESNLLAQRRLNCSVVENLGTALTPTILTEVNDNVAGTRHRINRRKTLVINEVLDASFNGCEITLLVDSTLERKVRRDAHGTFEVRGTISSFNLPRREVCYTDARVTDVSLSRTLSLGETIYRWVANRVLPNNQCFRQ